MKFVSITMCTQYIIVQISSANLSIGPVRPIKTIKPTKPIKPIEPIQVIYLYMSAYVVISPE